MILLTVPEIGRLLASLHPPRPPGHAEHWTGWRRRQQARARGITSGHASPATLRVRRSASWLPY